MLMLQKASSLMALAVRLDFHAEIWFYVKILGAKGWLLVLPAVHVLI